MMFHKISDSSRSTLLFAAFALLQSLCGSFAFADPNEDSSKAIQLFRAMGMEKAHQRNVEKFFQLKLRSQPELIPFKDEVRAIFIEKMNWKELQPVAEGIVLQNFSESEIEQMTKFYSTPIGKKSIELLPLIFADILEKGRQDVDAGIEKLISQKRPKKPVRR